MAVKRGGRWLSSSISKRLSMAIWDTTEKENALILTGRQSQVLRMISEGHSTKQISTNELSLSIKTVETYRAQIMEKLDIHDIAGLVRYAIRQGITPL